MIGSTAGFTPPGFTTVPGVGDASEVVGGEVTFGAEAGAVSGGEAGGAGVMVAGVEGAAVGIVGAVAGVAAELAASGGTTACTS